MLCWLGGMENDFDRWNEKKKALSAVGFDKFVHEREVWWCALGKNLGVEANGKHDNFERPVLVLKKFSRDSVLVVPLTTHIQVRRYHVVFPHRGGRAAAAVSQIRLISTKRLLRRIYRMDGAIFDQIAEQLMAAISPRSTN